MKHALAIVIACGLTSPVLAQTQNSEPGFEGLGEFADGMRKLLEGFAEDIEPLMEDLATRLEGLRGYHPPEVLPNGDIIIRKRTPEDTEPAPEQEQNPEPDGGTVEL